MRKASLLLFTIVVLGSCNNKKDNIASTNIQKEPSTDLVSKAVSQSVKDSIAKADSLKKAMNATKVPINKNGPMYISANGDYFFRIISKNDSKKAPEILLRNEISGQIYKMERVISAAGEKFQDTDGNYFWIKEDGFAFGNKNKVIAEGPIQPKNAE